MLTATVAAFAIALCLGFAGVPIAKSVARKIGLVDHPDQQRKLHKQAIPLVGGIVTFVATVISVAVVSFYVQDQIPGLTLESRQLVGLLLASFLILMLGVIDDRFMIRGRQKLLGQFIAATVLICFGYQFNVVEILDKRFEFELQFVSFIVAYGWILVGINSVNLLDGADGFATTIGILTSLALSVMAFHLGNYDDAVLCAAMAGALVAFMFFNFPPASAYLGDAGSMLIGLFIAAMAIKSSYKQATAYAFLAPIALLAIPMFDTLAAIVRRRLTGRSIYTVDRGHLHHALMGKGFGPRRALLLFFAMCLMTATGATMSIIYGQAEYALLSIMAVGVFLVVGRVFGFAEYRLITNRSKSVLRSILHRPRRHGDQGHHATIRLQGRRNWELCWQVLREFAEASRIRSMTMDLNLPWIHESFHANYKNAERKGAAEEFWSLELPIMVNDRLIGRIDLDASVQDTHFAEVVLELNEVLGSLEAYFVETIGGSLSVAGLDGSNDQQSGKDPVETDKPSRSADAG